MATLFFDAKLTVEQFLRWYSVKSSVQFFECADTQLTRFFETQTGLKPGKHVSISVAAEELLYEKGEISKILIHIYVNHNWNPVTMLWKSKSGRIYSIEDEDIDCNDIEFWFEGLDPLLYHQQLYPNEKLSFKLKELSYELQVTRLALEDCTIDMYLLPQQADKASVFIEQIDVFIDKYNEKSVKQNRKYGVVHNWKRKTEADRLVYEIDTGSAGTLLLKKLLPFLSQLNCFSKVDIC